MRHWADLRAIAPCQHPCRPVLPRIPAAFRLTHNRAMANALPLQHPRSRSDLFWSFTWLALQGFGGVMAVIQRELVDRKRWLTREQFVEEWAVAQTLPGPNAINLCVAFGARHFGLSGALAAMAGMLAGPLVIVLLVALLYADLADQPIAQGALRGMGAVAAGLVTATGLRLAGALKTHPLGWPLAALIALLGVIAVALLRWPLIWVLLGLGSLSCLLTYARLGRQAATKERP